MIGKFGKHIIAFILLFNGINFAQVYPSISNVLRYGTGQRSIATYKGKFEYFENLTDLKISFPKNITAGIRFLYDSPPEIGTPFKGLKRRFVEYRDDNIYLRVGNFSELYGRGTAINLFESRGIGYDTWMDGLSAKYSSKYFNVSLVGGSLDFRDSVELSRKEYYDIRGGNVEIVPSDFLSAGFSFIHAKGNFKLLPADKQIEANIPSFYLTTNLRNLSFLVDYSYKRTREMATNKIYGGYGLYSSLSYNFDKAGITIDYKNYLYDEEDPFTRNDISRTMRMLPFQNPPIVMKEQSYTLLTRAIHKIDFNDEVGLQLEVFYSINENTSLDFNASLASRHNLFLYDNNAFSFSKLNRNGNFLPSLNEKYSPYYELFTEVEHFLAGRSSFKIAAATRSMTLYIEFTGGENNHIMRSTVFPFQIKHTFNDSYSFEIEYEYESVYDNYNNQSRYYNQLISFINSFFSKFTITVRYEFTNNHYDLSGRRNWETIECGLRINQNHSVTISYGKERGGQICSNGVCRYLQPFEGFRFNLISNI